MINIKEDEHLHVLNHSCAHLLAQAVKHLYPHAKFWVGPVITDGFYYDIDLGDDVLHEEDLPKIEKEMKKIAKDGKRIVRHEISKEEALEMFKEDPYKMDLISHMDEADTVISCYTQGDFTDLCRGPHVESVKELKHFKLLKVSGAYWKGDANNKMLQRVYGICFDSEEEVQNYLNFLEEAKKRDHKKLGRELDLFMMSEYGPGFPFFLPNGMILRNVLENYWYEEHTKEGYQFIKTPIMLSKELWELSGHWANYQENMYTTMIDDREFAIKPMNCPGGMLVYKNGLHSYKDLPLRVGELGQVHRHEASGALNGLFRVRTFTQDDAHIFMREDQIESEVVRLINFIDRVYSVFGLSYAIELSTRPEKKYIGSIEIWDKAEAALEAACHAAGKSCKINLGDGAFYGPKLDFHLTDSLGRVFFGSIERSIGILIEHYAGAFPMWLAPQQVVIVPVHHERHLAYAQQLEAMLLAKGVRVKVDGRNEKLGYRVREAQTHKIPMQIVVGDGEVENGTATVRRYGKKDSVTITKEELLESILNEIETKVRV